jgi:predicted AAA+ superfamily ATPase
MLGNNSNTFYWLSKDQKEIDLLIEEADRLIPIEIKSGQTRNASFFSNLIYWQKLSGQTENLSVIYGGTEDLKTTAGNYIGWKNSAKAFSQD